MYFLFDDIVFYFILLDCILLIYDGRCLFSREHMTRIDPGDMAKGLTAEVRSIVLVLLLMVVLLLAVICHLKQDVYIYIYFFNISYVET